MLTAIAPDGTLSWDCLLFDEDGDLLSCGQPRFCALTEVEVVSTEVTRGTSLALPRCPKCRTQVFLKASYTLKEVVRCLLLAESADGTRRYALLPLSHTYNLLACHALYLAGRLPNQPVLALPPAGFPVQDGLPLSVLYAAWFGYEAVRLWGEQQQQHLPSRMPFLLP